MKLKKDYESDEQRILRNVEIDHETGCWNWTKRIEKGYGRLIVGSRLDGSRKVVRAHRFSYEIFIGEISNGLHVCHRCDNRKCVNPSHLFLGTQQENNADRDSKGRNVVRYGENNSKSKFTDEQVEDIKIMYKCGASMREIARLLNCHHSSVSNIVNGRCRTNGSCTKRFIPEPPETTREDAGHWDGIAPEQEV